MVLIVWGHTLCRFLLSFSNHRLPRATVLLRAVAFSVFVIFSTEMCFSKTYLNETQTHIIGESVITECTKDSNEEVVHLPHLLYSLPHFTVKHVISDARSTLSELRFGISEEGSTVPSPPPLPFNPPTLHAWFSGNGDGYFEQFLDETSETKIWTLNYTMGVGDDLTISWGNLNLPGSITIRSSEGDFQRDMNEFNSFTFLVSVFESLKFRFE